MLPPPTDQAGPDAVWVIQEAHSHEPALRGYLRSRFPSVEVDDVVQESYLRVWKAHAARPINSAKAFLFRVARHVALDSLRKRRNAPFDPLGDPGALRVMDERPSAAESVQARENLDLLANAVAALPTRCREVIMLHKIEGLSQAEVAGRLGLSERTVENHVRLGVRHCEDYLRERGLRSFLAR